MLRKLFISFESLICSKKVKYCFEHMNCSFENIFPKKVNYLLRKYDFSYENMNGSKKVNYLLRKYGLLFQEYAKATPKCDALMSFEYFLGKLLKK